MPVTFETHGARALDYGGVSTARPVLFVPSLINPPFILDLAPETSLLRWLAMQGFRPFLLDWGTPSPTQRDRDITAHVERILLPMIAQFDTPPVLAGYCLGGTLALAAATRADVAGLAMIAAPWRFAGFGGAAREEMAGLWNAGAPACEAMGLVPIELLQSGFWKLDPARTIDKYAAFAAMAPDSPEARAFVRLEDWANAGAPLAYAAGRQLFADFVAADTPGSGAWTVAGESVDPGQLTCPAVDFVSRHDRIVPALTASGIADRRDLSAGHVGMIVGRHARTQLWEPLADWLSAIPGTR